MPPLRSINPRICCCCAASQLSSHPIRALTALTAVRRLPAGLARNHFSFHFHSSHGVIPTTRIQLRRRPGLVTKFLSVPNSIVMFHRSSAAFQARDSLLFKQHWILQGGNVRGEPVRKFALWSLISPVAPNNSTLPRVQFRASIPRLAALA